jgi:hypothetical protein
MNRKRIKTPVSTLPARLTEKDKDEYRRIQREIGEALQRIAAESGSPLEEPAETHAEARARLVRESLATGWRVRTRSQPLERRRPELFHPAKSYTLGFYGHKAQQNGAPTLDDCRSWTLERLLAHCDERSTPEAYETLTVREALDELNAGVPGHPSDLVFKIVQARMDAWFDKSRERPPKIPIFETDAAERRYWAKHDVLVYFAEVDFLDRIEEA